MKNSILYLGIALVFFANVCNASSIIKQNDNNQVVVLDDYNKGVVLSNDTASVSASFLENESDVFNPETVIAYNSNKTIREIIIENDKITEFTSSDDLEFINLEIAMKEVIAQSDLVIENTVSAEVYPLDLDRSMEEVIAEYEKIIESTVSNEVCLLDFKKINKDFIIAKSFNSKVFVGMN